MAKDDKLQEGKLASEFKWHEGAGFVFFMLLCFGPLAFPLLFKSRKFTAPSKALITILISIITVYAVILTVDLIQDIVYYYRRIM